MRKAQNLRELEVVWRTFPVFVPLKLGGLGGQKSQKLRKPQNYISETPESPLNPPILGDFELRKAQNLRELEVVWRTFPVFVPLKLGGLGGQKSQKLRKPQNYISETPESPLNPPILGDFELRKAQNLRELEVVWQTFSVFVPPKLGGLGGQNPAFEGNSELHKRDS